MGEFEKLRERVKGGLLDAKRDRRPLQTIEEMTVSLIWCSDFLRELQFFGDDEITGYVRVKLRQRIEDLEQKLGVAK